MLVRPLVLVLALAGVTAAQQPRKNIDCDLEDTDLRDCMAQMGRQTAQNILVDPNVSEKVTVSLRDIPWREAVDVIARMTRCEIEELDGGILILHQPARVTVQMQEGTSVRSVLHLLAAYAGQNIIMTPGVSGAVAVDLKEEHWKSALETVVAAAKLHLSQRGPVWVVSDQPLPAPPQGPPAPAPADDGKKVDVDVDGVDLTEVCEQVGRAVGRNILVDPNVQEKVTVALKAAPWRAAVAAIARITRCQVEERPGGILILSQPPKVTMQAHGAPAAAWFRLLATQAGLNITQGELHGTIDCDLKELSPRDALLALAEAHRIGVERRGDTVVLTPPADGLPAAAPARSPVDALLKDIDKLARAGDAAGLEPRLRDLLATVKAGRAARAARPEPKPASPEAAAEIEELFAKITKLAEERKVEELVQAFTALRELMGREGMAGNEAVRKALAKWNERLGDLGEVQLSIQLQVYISEGNAHLRAMADAIRLDDFAACHRSMRELTALVETMRDQEREVFHRNAEALYLRGKALDDRARRLEKVAAVPLHVTGIFVGDPAGAASDQAIINGWLVAEGDAPRDAAGEELTGYRVVEIVRSCVRLRFEDTEFVRELGPR